MLGLVVFLALPLLADDTVSPEARAKALELLDGAAETAAGARPDVAASAMMYVAENYEQFNHKRAVEYMRQSFAGTAAIPPDSEGHQAAMQSRIVSAMVPISLPDAAEMIRQVQPANDWHDYWRQQAIKSLVVRLIEKKQIDDAIATVNSVGATGQYPFAACQTIFEKLPSEDDRRQALFGYAMSAYAVRPGADFIPFVAHHWKDIPRSTAEAAVSSIVKNILDEEDDRRMVRRFYGPKGTVTLHGSRDINLFDVMYIVHTVDKKRYAEIVDQRPELKAALARFPNGRLSFGDHVSIDESGDAVQAAQRTAADASRGAAMAGIEKLLEESPEPATPAEEERLLNKLLELAKSIPDTESRLELLAQIAGSVGEDEPQMARKIISDCIEVLKDVKDLPARVASWNNLAEAAHDIKDDSLAWDAMNHGLADCMELYKIDTDADMPNTNPRDVWPTTNAFRRVVIAATKLFGPAAEPLLAKITDPDLALFARVEMAQALLGRPHQGWITSSALKKP